MRSAGVLLVPGQELVIADAGRVLAVGLAADMHLVAALPVGKWIEFHQPAAAIDEIARRGLDPALLVWLRAAGKTEFPDTYRVTDANPLPPGWRNGYWLNMYETFNPSR